ncbi:MAG: hypothetical protein II877_02070, partial [Synergistaceae bacterium]|nr:hypothetical protein [Synergistaceae bacterium]
MRYEIIAERDYDRLDVFMSEQLDMTRTQVQKLIRNGNIKGEDDLHLKGAKKVIAGQKFIAEIPESLNINYLKADKVD